jgi:prepilin-type processing-associated H-X9-DG protein
MAAHSFESQFERLPPGTLGMDSVPTMTEGEQKTWFNDGGAWEDFQHVSSLVLLLPQLDGAGIYDILPKVTTSIGTTYRPYREQNGAPHWIGHLPEVEKAMHTKMATFVCPTDPFDDGSLDRCVVATQPHMLEGPGGEPLGDYFGPAYQFDRAIAKTNFLGCAGAHSGGETPDLDRRPYTGVMSCRQRIPLSNIVDGTSHTVMYGENIGQVDNGLRSIYNCWFFGGLARARGHWPWKGVPPNLEAQADLLGNAWFSSAPGFGSCHPSGVNFAMCDGSVRSISREIFWPEFYALCGAFDHQIVQ